MKKIIAILAVFATAFTLASCSVKNDKTTAELVSEQEAEYQQLIESMSQAEAEVSENVIKNVEDIGKTQKNKQIVVKVASANSEHYQVFIFNRKGICQKIRDYYFYDTVDKFEIADEKQKETSRKKKVDSDKDARMIVLESDYEVEERNQFDQILELYKNEDSKAQGFEVIE